MNITRHPALLSVSATSVMPLKSERRRSLVAKRFSISSSDAKCTPGGRTPKGAPSLYMNVGIMTQHYRWVKDRVHYICPIVGLYATACSNRNKILDFPLPLPPARRKICGSSTTSEAAYSHDSAVLDRRLPPARSEAHTYELQSLM